jgi:FG-GAP-like repeat
MSVLTKAVVAADYDNDGYADLFVSNFRGDSALLHNNHDGTLTDVAPQAGVQASGHGFASWFFDYDNDGRQDLLATSCAMSVEEAHARTWDCPTTPPIVIVPKLNTDTLKPDVPKRRCSISTSKSPQYRACMPPGVRPSAPSC